MGDIISMLGIAQRVGSTLRVRPVYNKQVRAYLANIRLDKVAFSLLPLNSCGLRPLEALSGSLS